MSARDRLLAVLVAVCWGVNFPATALALRHFPPLLTVGLRFTLVAIPTMVFVPRPRVQLRWLLGVGLGIGLTQFAFLYLGMTAGMPSGLASLVLQASAPFTLVLAGVFLGERITARQLAGVGVAVVGLGTIAAHRAQVASVLPVILTLCGGMGWAIGNVCSRRAQAPNPLHLTLWMSVVPPLPVFALSWFVEGPRRIGSSLATAFTRPALPAVLGLLYVAVVATIVGYGLWNTLLTRNASSVVSPFSMLVPVIGVLASYLAFGETVDAVELIAGAAVIAGVLYASRRGPAGADATGRQGRVAASAAGSHEAGSHEAGSHEAGSHEAGSHEARPEPVDGPAGPGSHRR